MLDAGYSITYIHSNFGINATLLKTLYLSYKELGIAGLQKKKNIKFSVEQKLSVILEFENNNLSLDEVYYKYSISESAFNQWRKEYASGGTEALRADGRGRPRKAMERPKRRKEPQTELEKLQEENLRLKIELELLKKVDALVREKENRLKELGRKPSRN